MSRPGARPAGYSGTPLARKLGIVTGSTVLALGAPEHYRALLAPLPEPVRFANRLSGAVSVVHVFVTRRSDLARRLAALRPAIAPDAAVWVSWPKRASGVASDVDENVVRAEALPIGFVDVKVCAVDEVWSGLKLVIRKALRAPAPARAARGTSSPRRPRR